MITNETLQQAINVSLESDKETWPVKSNWVSMLADKCDRKLAYNRTHWEKKPSVSNNLQGIFNTGNEMEDHIKEIVNEVGKKGTPQFRIDGERSSKRDKFMERYQIGHQKDVNLYMKENKRWKKVAVVDLKSASPYTFSALSDIASLDKFPWTKKYYGQAMMYALAEEIDTAGLLFINKTNWYQMLLMLFPIDYGYCESLIKKAEKTNAVLALHNAAVDSGKYKKLGDENKYFPAHIKDVAHCLDCQFLQICNPPLESTGNLEVLDDEEMIATVKRRQELAPMKKEFELLDKHIKATLVKGQDLIAGDHSIFWNHYKKKGFTVKESEVYSMKIIDNIA